ncbi:MAG: nuclear transport factor 2 family protein [Flavisolibacter sp.]
MKFLVALLTLFLGLGAAAQNDTSSIKENLNRLFEGMRRSDTGMIRSAFAPGAVLQTIARDREGKIQLETAPLDSFLVSISHPHQKTYDERIRFDQIRIDGDLASVWTPYQFYLGETFHHCGVDSYQLVRLNGEWKIQYLIDTRRKAGCN